MQLADFYFPLILLDHWGRNGFDQFLYAFNSHILNDLFLAFLHIFQVNFLIVDMVTAMIFSLFMPFGYKLFSYLVVIIHMLLEHPNCHLLLLS